MLYPIKFIPRLKERLWGGHELLASVKAGKGAKIDAEKCYGESWELSAVPGDESVVANDYMFSVQTGHYAKKIELCREQIVCVTVREGSLCDDYFGTDEKTMSRLNVYAGVQRFFDNNHIALEPLFRFLRGIRGNKRYLFSESLAQCKRYGYSLLEVIFRCFIGFFRTKFKSKTKFC